MPKYRKSICQDEGFSKGFWYIAPIDLRKKYYFCAHCQKEHLVKDGVVKEIPNDKRPFSKRETALIYNPCCSIRCLVGGCKTREQGGCYCVCRLVDHINIIKGVIDGTILEYGSVYIPDEENRKKYWDKKSEEEKEKHLFYQKIDCPDILKRLEKSLENYKI